MLYRTMPTKASGRTLKEFFPLKPAELLLLNACRTGSDSTSFSHIRPARLTEDNRVRASFVRFLALGGDQFAPVHEHGVNLGGVWINGELDLKGARIASSFSLTQCAFDDDAPLQLRGAHIQGDLILSGCNVSGLDANYLVCAGDVSLDDGFSATGEVLLQGAQIAGNLICSGATLNVIKGDALSADNAVIRGDVFLNEGFSSVGAVRLPSIQIAGTLTCTGAHFKYISSNDSNALNSALMADSAQIKGDVFLDEFFSAIGTVRLPGAMIGGDLVLSKAVLEREDAPTFEGRNMVVAGNFFFNDFTSPISRVSLSHAKVGQLIDDKDSWGTDLILDGFEYACITREAPTDARTRLKWIDKQSAECTGTDGNGLHFRPQPWRQLQKVLREMGHIEEARQVAIAFEDRLRKAGLVFQTSAPEWSPRSWLIGPVINLFHWLFGKLIGYGYRPMLLVVWMLAVWLICASFYWHAALHGVFAPSNPLIFQNAADYATCVPDSVEAKIEFSKPISARPVRGAGNWYLCEKLREEYTGFSPLTYSLDLILPLVDLQQEHDWAPMIPTPNPSWDIEIVLWDLKRLTRFMVWLEILFGWMSSLLLVAAVSGLTKRRED